MQFEFSQARQDGKFLIIDCGSRFKVTSVLEKIKNGVPYICEIKQKRKRRSLDANAYFWVMCSKLSAVLKIPKEELYRQMIKDIGDNSFIAPIENEKKDKVQKLWNDKGIGWLTEEISDSKIKGYTNVEFYFGSSSYDTAQMSRLIDIVIEECKEQNIDTLSERERSLLLEEWDAQAD